MPLSASSVRFRSASALIDAINNIDTVGDEREVNHPSYQAWDENKFTDPTHENAASTPR